MYFGVCEQVACDWNFDERAFHKCLNDLMLVSSHRGFCSESSCLEVIPDLDAVAINPGVLPYFEDTAGILALGLKRAPENGVTAASRASNNGSELAGRAPQSDIDLGRFRCGLVSLCALVVGDVS